MSEYDDTERGWLEGLDSRTARERQEVVLGQVRDWAVTLRDDLIAYSRDRNPEQRSISPGLMLVRLRPVLDLLDTTTSQEEA